MAAVIERTLETTPADATHWSLRSMARESGLSHTTVRRIYLGLPMVSDEKSQIQALEVPKSVLRRRLLGPIHTNAVDRK